jgi:hypothetical protein
MALVIEQLSVDAVDPFATATWWAQALNWRLGDDQGSADEEVWIHLPDSPTDGILFCRVPEEKTTKNRLHLDLRPDDQEAEVARLESLGAARVDIGQGDVTWVVLADPFGNEFCVLRSRGAVPAGERPTC